MILDPIALATEGQLAPAAGGKFCLAPLTLASGGVIVLEVDDDAKLADPRTFKEPFDLGYYRTKYGKRQQRPVPTSEAVADVVDLSDYLEQLAREQREEDVQRTRLRIREQNTEVTERLDRLEAERLELESRLETLAVKHEAVLEAILLAKLELRRHRNEEAAAIAVAMFYFY